ncbi:MAG: DMT family transporter [Gammaproteobacteria bacterium]
MKPLSSKAFSHSNRRGIGFMLLGIFLIISMDIAAKWLLEIYPVSQLVLLRSLFSMLTISCIAAFAGKLGDLHSSSPGWHLLRSVFMAGSMFAFFSAIQTIPLAVVVTIAFAGPLIVTALSWPVLGESVGPWRWLAVITGFCGVVIVARPGPGLIQAGALYAVAGTFMWAGLSLTARKMSGSESNISLSFYIFILPLLLGGIGSVGNWLTPNGMDLALFVLCGVLGGLSFSAINAAFRCAPAAVVVPFEYSGLIWATAAGWLIWDEGMDLVTVFGALVIIASGLLLLYRESRGPGDVTPEDFAVQDAVPLARRK